MTPVDRAGLVGIRRACLSTLERPRREPKRASSLGIPESVKCPAGLDIGAVTPEEIALNILAEIVSIRRARGASPEGADASMAQDPICGMMVAVDGARHTLTRGEETYYFCGAGCKDAYELKHAD